MGYRCPSYQPAELSLTSDELALVSQLAMTIDALRLQVFAAATGVGVSEKGYLNDWQVEGHSLRYP